VTDNPAADSPNILPTDVESLQRPSQPGEFPEYLAAMIQDYPGLIQEFPSVELVRFDSDSTDIAHDAHSLLCEYATALNSEEFKDSVFLIVGHADSTGSPAYNLKLSERRAEAVNRVLVSNCGLDTSRLFIIGYGAHYPVASNEKKQGRAFNRRVEFIRLGNTQGLPSEAGG
jgi:outer membrane protein OmpA-like peptidoglycan-associated protein